MLVQGGYMKKINPVMVIFLLLGLRAAILGSDIGMAIALASICSLYGFKEYLKSKQVPDINKAVIEELAAIKNYVTGLSMKQTLTKKDPIMPPNKERGERWF